MFSGFTPSLSGKVTKAVIPVAGLGTRMLPATKAIPKEMLPLVDKPLIQYIINECAASGIAEVIFVTHSSKNSIENHFDTSFELEAMLEKRVKRQLLAEVQSICPHNVTTSSIRQGLARGLGHAIACAYSMIGNEPFAVLLPDVILDEFYCDMKKDNLAGMIERYHQSRRSQILVEPVLENNVSLYGIVDCHGAEMRAGESAQVFAVIEKPDIDKAPSNQSIVGRYVFSEKIWPLLAKTAPGRGDEIQLTDAIARLINYEEVDAYCITGKSHDCGNKLGYVKAFIEYALRHATLGGEVASWINALPLTGTPVS